MKKPSFLRKELTCCLDRVWTFSLPSSIWRYSCYLLSSESTSWTREAHRFFFLLLCVQVRQQRQSGPRQALGLQLRHGSGKRQLWQGDACSSACQKKQPAGVWKNFFTPSAHFQRSCLQRGRARTSCTPSKSWRRTWWSRTTTWSAPWWRNECWLCLENLPSSRSCTPVSKQWLEFNAWHQARYTRTHVETVLTSSSLCSRTDYILWWSI